MPRLRSVVDLLAEQSEDALVQMRDSVRAELARLTVEAQQIEQALAKKTRKSRTGGGRLTRDQVYDLVASATRPHTTAEIHERITASGVPASVNAVRNHLNRLADNERLARYPDGQFWTSHFAGEEPPLLEPDPDFVDDDIPF